MPNVEMALLGLASMLAAVRLGGGFYETGIVDPAWPNRPDIVSPRHGGINRKWFWIPANVAFELALVLSLIPIWSQPTVRFWLLIALASHVCMRLWSAFDFIPKALRFEAMEPGAIDAVAARRWTRRSRLRLPLDVITCSAMLAAVVALARLS
jgi:hypothetical protein